MLITIIFAISATPKCTASPNAEILFYNNQVPIGAYYAIIWNPYIIFFKVFVNKKHRIDWTL